MLKRILSVLLAIMMVLSAIPAFAIDADLKADLLNATEVGGYTGDYTVEFDMTVPVGTSASFIFAGSDDKNFVSFQINPKSGKYSLIKHEGGKAGEAASLAASDLADKKIHVKIDVVGTTATVYADGTKVFDYTHASLVTFGAFGFRHYNSTNDQEKAYYDNLVVKSAAGKTLYSADFSSVNPFKVGSLVEGQLYVEPISGNISVSTIRELVAIDYTVEFDMTVPAGTAASFIFAGSDEKNFVSFQINPKSNKYSLVKHEGGKAGEAASLAASDLADKKIHVKIDVVGATATVYADGTKVFDYTHASLVTFGVFGFRHWNSDGEEAYYDNLEVKAADGKEIFEFDFASANPFEVGSLVEGQLYVEPISGNVSVSTIRELLAIDYTVEFDMTVPAETSASFIFAGSDEKNFVSFQINPKSGKYSLIKHEGGKAGEAASLAASDLADKKIHVKIDVVGATATVYADGTKVFDYTHASLVTFGVFGFRHYNSTNDQEKAYYDNLVVKAADGKEIFEFDFASANPFEVGSLVEGQLYVEPISGNVSVSTWEELLAALDLGIDINDDGETNAADVSALLQSLNGNGEVDQTLADVNADGKISLADALHLLKLLTA